jgi:superfamily I DNA/RNA helicase
MSLSEIEFLRVSGISGELLSKAIGRMRSGKVSIKPGYDGEYGTIRAFAPGERIEGKAEKALFDSGIDVTTIKASAGAKPRKAKHPKSGKGEASHANALADTGLPQDFKLEPEQERAVAHEGGPALVVAGPGTGKTAVLALRVERLVTGSAARPGLDPSAILALTFTNKAAGELRVRLGRTLGEGKAAAIAASTFHSFCRSLLRENATQAGLEPDFKLLDEDERCVILEPLAGSAAKAKRLGVYIEGRKRFLLRPGDAAPPLGPGAPATLVELAEELGLPEGDAEMEAQYAAYRDALKQKGALDFADLIAGAVRLLASRPAILAACRERYRAIFVDEYQDVDFAQYALVRLLAPDDASNLFVIGDPNQAIYGFRGADQRFLGRFLVDYPKTEVYRLTRSFRCAPAIIGAASGIVGATGLEGSGAAVALARSEYPTDKSEAEAIAREIDRLIGGTRFFARDSGVAEGQEGELASLAACAVLVRAAALLEPIAKALDDHGIPYRIAGEDPEAPYEIREERVSLMTIHAAKGLEFDYVFVAGLEEGILPFTLFDKDEGDEASEERIAEESRILYVAMTRARIGLHLSWARSRLFKGRMLELQPSSFLSRLEELVPLVQAERHKERDPQLGLFPS